MESIGISSSIHRVRRDFGWLFLEESEVEREEEKVPDKVSPLARMLALAHRYQALIDSGEVHDQSELARKIKLSRNRVSQILSLTLLEPGIQMAILQGEFGELSTRELLAIAQEVNWARQRGRVRN